MTQERGAAGSAAAIGLPREVCFDGLLEGTIADRQVLEHALAALRQLRAPAFDISLEGDRCCLLVDDAPQPGRLFTPAHWAAVQSSLDHVLATLVHDGDTMSSLRCIERYHGFDRELLLPVVDGQLELVERIVPRAADGVGHAGPAGARRRTLLASLLFGVCALVVGGAVIGYQARQHRRHPLTTIQCGDFAPLLVATVEESWGRYRIHVRRGPGYPATPAAVRALADGAHSVRQRSAVDLVADGGDIYVVAEDARGLALETMRLSLRPLLQGPLAQAQQELPGDVRTCRLRLSAIEPEAP